VKLYLRIRTVEWQVSERYFECIADETFAREPGFELEEVRGSPRIEMHFVELQKTFEHLGFDVSTDMNAISWALHKRRTELRLARVRIISIRDKAASSYIRSNLREPQAAPVEVDFSRPFNSTSFEAWNDEYLANVRLPPKEPLAKPTSQHDLVPRSYDNPFLDDWRREAWEDYLEFESTQQETEHGFISDF
jgi:hypothetical protein